MKIYDEQQKHIKTVPKYFINLPNLRSFFTDLDHKRLTRDERTNIEVALFKLTLPDHDRIVIGSKMPFCGRQIVTRDGDNYHTLVFSGNGERRGIEVKCPLYLYKMMGKKQLIRRLF